MDWDEKRLVSLDNQNDYYFCKSLVIDLFYQKTKAKLDLSSFKNLERLGCDYREVFNLETLQDLISLDLSNYKQESEDLNKLRSLNELILTRGNLVNLSFLSSMPKLEKVQLNYLNKLNDINDLKKCKSIKRLDIERCKNISNLEIILSELNTLKVLKIYNYKFKSLNWVKKIENLEQLILSDSDILDGDISPAKDIPYVFIENKRHFNYRFDQESRKIIAK